MSETSCNWLLECLPCFSMNTPRTFLEGSWQPHRPSEYEVSISTAFNTVSMENGHGGQHFFIILVQSLSHVWLFETPWTAAYQASQSITNSQSLPKLMSIQSVMPSSRFVFCRSLLLLPWYFQSIRVFSKESVLCMRWPKHWSFSFNISPSNEYSGLISFRMDWLDLLEAQGTLKSLLQHHNWKTSILRHSAFYMVQL